LASPIKAVIENCSGLEKDFLKGMGKKFPHV
jgi:hypothetical protein